MTAATTKTTIKTMASIQSCHPRGGRPRGRHRFYTAAFGLADQLRLRASDAPTTGFRGFTLTLTVSQPATVRGLIDSAVDAGATPLKPVAKSFWGYGGVMQSTGRDDLAGRDLGEEGHRRGHREDRRGRAAARRRRREARPSGSTSSAASRWRRASAASTSSSPPRRVPSSWRSTGAAHLAKDAGVAPEGTGSHRLVLGSDGGPFTDPDGFAWEAAPR